MKTIAVFALLVWSIAAAANAADHGYPNGVTKVMAGTDNYLYINVAGNLDTTVHGCPNGAFARSALPLTDARTEALMRIATTSFLSGHAVHLYTSGCTPGGLPDGGYAIMTKLQVYR